MNLDEVYQLPKNEWYTFLRLQYYSVIILERPRPSWGAANAGGAIGNVGVRVLM